MAVTSCKLVSVTGTNFDERNLMSCTATFRIIDDTPGRGRTTILNEATTASPNNFPTHWDHFAWLGETDLYTYARTFTIDLENPEESNKVYLAKVNYRPFEPGQSSNYSNTNPFLRDPIWNGDIDVSTKVVDQDKDGDPIVNSAGKPFDPGIERPNVVSVVTATFNYTDLSTAISVSRSIYGAVNSATWQGQGVREVWCTEARPTPQVTEGSNTFYPVAFRFALAKDGETWDDEILNRGFGYLSTASDYTTFTATDEEVILAADGTKITDPASATYETFRTRPEVNFTTTLGF